MVLDYLPILSLPRHLRDTLVEAMISPRKTRRLCIACSTPFFLTLSLITQDNFGLPNSWPNHCRRFELLLREKLWIQNSEFTLLMIPMSQTFLKFSRISHSLMTLCHTLPQFILRSIKMPTTSLFRLFILETKSSLETVLLCAQLTSSCPIWIASSSKVTLKKSAKRFQRLLSFKNIDQIIS